MCCTWMCSTFDLPRNKKVRLVTKRKQKNIWRESPAWLADVTHGHCKWTQTESIPNKSAYHGYLKRSTHSIRLCPSHFRCFCYFQLFRVMAESMSYSQISKVDFNYKYRCFKRTFFVFDSSYFLDNWVEKAHFCYLRQTLFGLENRWCEVDFFWIPIRNKIKWGNSRKQNETVSWCIAPFLQRPTVVRRWMKLMLEWFRKNKIGK